MDLELTDKVAVITGGSEGIGYAVARAFAREGAHTLICARNLGALARAAEAVRADFKTKCVAVEADVTLPEQIEKICSVAERELGGVDFLINNAGTGTNETIMEAGDEKWQGFWDLHVMAAVRLARGLVPSMKRRGGGVILNNASICATQPLGYEPIYNVTKAALVMLSKCMANEFIPDNIRVNAVNPGLILTKDWVKSATALGAKEGISAEEYLDRIAKENAPIGRFATPEELADFFVFLCSPRASYSVGSSYYVDGGWLRTIA
jgi:NAD(P)-dependent dehydrogenase (short-subunit alcohol dehydrogenase family)